MTPRLAIVVSHPIQYQVPWFRALAAVTDLTVFFCHRQDSRGQADAGFGVDFEWDVPLLEGYNHRFLTNVSAHPGVSSFGGCDTPEIVRLIASGGFDVCIVSGWYLKSYLQAIRACRRAGVPVLLRGDSHLGTARSRLTSLIKYVPYTLLLRSVQGHLCVGAANRRYLRHYGVREDRLFAVPHFVDSAFFRERSLEARGSQQAEDLRRRAGASEQTVLVACVGKLVPGKRVDDFIRALTHPAAVAADVRGLVVGSGPEQGRLESLARDIDARVTFVGFQNQTELPTCFAAADALAVPSGSETWGLVVNEAMAAGLPAIVSSAVGCAEDLIDDGRTGFVVPVGDVPALAARMGELATLLRQQGRGITDAVLARIERYSVDAAVQGTLRAIASLHTDTEYAQALKAAR